MFDTRYRPIPPGLDDLEPGMHLAAYLGGIDVTRVSAHDQIVVMRARQRMASYYNAQVYESMASVADAMTNSEDDDPQLGGEAAAAEIRVALRLTRRAADAELGFALELKQRLPRVWAALAKGEIDVQRAKTIADGTLHLPVSVARDAVDRIIEHASGLTTGQLRARLDRLGMEADPEHAQHRYEQAVGDRRVVAEASTSGTANLLGLDLPPHRVTAVSRRINRLARSLNTSGESRSMDQIRADIFLDLLMGKTHSAEPSSRGVVDLHVDLDTLAGLTEHPGELAGYGPVVADIARQVTTEQEHAEWRYTITDPATGRPLYNGTTRRRPTANQRRTVETRDQTCIFPGCRMPATDCDLDHRTRWVDGGATGVDNLAPLCRHDHRIRHQAGWEHQPLPNGDHQWITKLGHTYTTSGRPP
ncbi:MAG: DUF222 domain-containing protein, partial [Acidobacteria bacterium]|nr:DUF222 domain-containing protein [Acidobacteriota bacterium]